MAEPAGLALGVVALASLFTTCIDLIDYFELSKSYEYDYEMACLKLSLLKSRLDAWGQTLQPGVGDSCQLDEELGCHESTVIRRSLQGIADILGSAELLKHKYYLSPRKSRNRMAVVIRRGHVPSVERKSQRQILSRIPSIPLVRRSTTWAIRDKQKFDNLISDLEFFISNLEAVSSRVHAPCYVASDMSEETTQPKAIGDSKDTSSSGELANQSARRTNPLPSAAVMAQNQDSQQPAIALPNFSATGSSTSHLRTAEGYTWSVDKMEDRSGVFYGTVGGATLAPAPAGQTVVFRVGMTTDDARVMGGAMSAENFDTFFNGASSRRN
jgi:hypothetical protein